MRADTDSRCAEPKGSYRFGGSGGTLMAMATTPATRRFTSDEVWQMVRIGLLEQDEPYELIDGELRYVSPQNNAHATAIRELTSALTLAYGPAMRVGVQLPIGGIVDSIPEPDFAVLTAELANQGRHPHANETLLIIEVSDTSVRRDVRKGAIYATAGAPEFWRIEVPRGIVIVHRGPQPDGTWCEATEIGMGGTLELPGIDQRLDASAFLTT